jgi:hypothetical protein
VGGEGGGGGGGGGVGGVDDAMSGHVCMTVGWLVGGCVEGRPYQGYARGCSAVPTLCHSL